MRYLILLLAMAIGQKGISQSLRELRWEHRVVFIMNPKVTQPMDHPQVRTLKDHLAEIQERDLIILIVHKGKVLNFDGAKFDMDMESIPYSSYTGLILIGKDGGVKLKEEFVVRPEKIFDLIDSMPMRRAEIKRSEKY